MKKSACLIVLLSIALYASAQDEGELKMVKSKIYHYGQPVKPKEVLNILKVSTEAYKEYSKAKSNYDAMNVFGFVGGAMIGWPIGTAIGGGDAQWGIAAGGAAVLLLAIPLSSGYKKHAQRAIDIYNKPGNVSASMRTRVDMNFTGAGARLTVTF
jgi:outer membrane lipoprotein SlyB